MVLVLSYKQMSSLLSVRDCVDSIEQVFLSYAKGAAEVVPNRIFHHFADDTAGIFSIGGVNREEDALVIKNLTVNWNNTRLRNKPHMFGILLLCEARTGEPLCIMDAVYMTNIRTGSVAGLAAKYLAPRDARSIAVIGSKEIAKYSLLAVKTVLPQTQRISVFSKTAENRRRFAEEMTRRLGLEVSETLTAVEAVKDADIVITATNASEPVIIPGMLKKGALLDSVGAIPEVDPKVLLNMRVIAESASVCTQYGKFSAAIKNGVLAKEDLFADLAEIIEGKKNARVYDESIMFDSVGLAIEDVALAHLAYKRAKEMNIGREIDLFEGIQD